MTARNALTITAPGVCYGQRFPCSPVVNRFPKILGRRSSGAFGCMCVVVLWLTTSQLGVDMRGTCTVGCMSSGCQHHQLALCVFCLSENLSRVCLRFFFWPVTVNFVPPPLSSDSDFTFQSFCMSVIFLYVKWRCVSRLQGSNSTNYIQNAFQLLLPVLQISHLQSQHSRSNTEPAAPTQH